MSANDPKRTWLAERALGAMKAPFRPCGASPWLLAHQLTTWLASLLIQVKTRMPRLPLASQC